jgi:uncharacterized protein GlcG (DUF336 family)
MQLEVRQSTLHHEAAQAALAAAVRKSEEMGVRVCVAVLDRGGNLLAFLRMIGAPVLSGDIARDKASTAIGFGMPTSAWAQILPNLSEQVRTGIPSRSGVAMFGGGVVVQLGGNPIGAIGVSGASEQQDEDIAKAAIAAIGAES